MISSGFAADPCVGCGTVRSFRDNTSAILAHFGDGCWWASSQHSVKGTRVDFVTGRPADLLALAVMMLAATRLPVLPTVIIAIAAAGILRHVLA